MSDFPVLDQKVLDELRDSVGGDDAFVADLVATYLVEGAAHVAQLQAAAATADVPGLIRPAHSLKSSSAAIGAARMSELGREIEHAGRDGRSDALALASSAGAVWDETLAELKTRGFGGSGA